MEMQGGQIYLSSEVKDQNCFVLEIPTLKAARKKE
jgi:hypothetical protein